MQRKIITLFWNVSSRYSALRLLALGLPVLAVSVNAIAGPYVLSQFLDRLQTGGITLENSWSLIAFYGGLVVLGEVVLWRLALYFTWTFEVHTIRDLHQVIFNKLSHQDLVFHADRFGGALVSQSTKFVGAFERFWDMIIWSVMPIISTVIGSIIVLSALGLWQYGLFLAVYAVCFGVVVYVCSRFLAQINRDEASASNRISGYLADMITNVSTVKSFGREDYEHAQVGSYAKDWHAASTKLKWGVLGATTAFSAMYAVGATAALIFAVLGAQYGVASVGMIYLIFIYALNINRQLWELNNITRTYDRVIGDADEMTKILEKDFDLIDNSNNKLQASKGDVSFSHISFTHDNGKGEQVFQDFNLSIPAGQRVGIVGHSGAGKTTLTNILLRFSDVEHGSITIDGQDISEVTQQSLHEEIAYVAQEPILFHRTLKENISYGRLDATHQQIIEAAKKAHAYGFITKLPDGLDTMVGERGIKLSGGQRQRIAIARAILKDAPILVLDEATSALDSESEKLIQDSLSDLMKDRTSIVIAHRLSTIAKLDRIIVLDQGRITEDGTHAELLTQNGTYSRLWSHQSGGFLEE
ncbi:MAG: ABC transporter ATP-binding protein [Candidatus Saccharimonadales bacterium]